MLAYQKLTPEHVADIYRARMQYDFPPAEVKPLEVLQNLMKQGRYECYGWFEESGDLVAYTFFTSAPQGKVMLLDYFAVCSFYRSHGYGSVILTLLPDLFQGRAGILAEVEDPLKSSSEAEESIRSRRVGFYQRNGLRPTTVYSVLFEVPYVLHYLPVAEDCTDAALRSELDAIYHTLFPQPIYDENVQLWLTESEA